MKNDSDIYQYRLFEELYEKYGEDSANMFLPILIYNKFYA